MRMTYAATCIVISGLLLMGCSRSNKDTVIRVGVSAGPMEQLLEDAVIPAAQREGLNVKAVVFNGYMNANQPLNEGDIEANAFQHEPFLRGEIITHGYRISPVAYTVIAPLGIYSRRYHSIKQLPDGATIGLPQDDSNLDRGLRILAHYGLIKLRADSNVQRDKATPLDISDNPHHYNFKEADPIILARSLSDFDAAAINVALAAPAGLQLGRDTLLEEPLTSDYRNVLVVRDADKNAAWVAKLIAAFHSPEVRHELATHFKHELLPAF